MRRRPKILYSQTVRKNIIKNDSIKKALPYTFLFLGLFFLFIINQLGLHWFQNIPPTLATRPSALLLQEIPAANIAEFLYMNNSTDFSSAFEDEWRKLRATVSEDQSSFNFFKLFSITKFAIAISLLAVYFGIKLHQPVVATLLRFFRASLILLLVGGIFMTGNVWHRYQSTLKDWQMISKVSEFLPPKNDKEKAKFSNILAEVTEMKNNSYDESWWWLSFSGYGNTLGFFKRYLNLKDDYEEIY